MSKIKVLLILLFSVILTKMLSGQNDTLDITFEPDDTLNRQIMLFERDELLEITLRFDITTYRREKPDEEELDAVLTYFISKTDSINKNVKLRARGIMRRSYCDMPPIRLNFRNEVLPGYEFSNIDKVKVVTHCRLGNSETVFREFLVYKLYNVLTDNSYRVRLARITYINTAKKTKPIQEYAFFIEPTEVLEKRLGMTEIQTTKVSQRLIRPEMMNRMAIFNYMVGNTDWSVPIYHNVVILTEQGLIKNNLLSIISYDFDQSGLVDAEYAAPFEGLGIETVKERRYLGICRNEEEFAEALKEFSEKKTDFIRVINDFPHLKERVKKEMVIYLNGFLNSLEKHNSIVHILQRECIEL